MWIQRQCCEDVELEGGTLHKAITRFGRSILRTLLAQRKHNNNWHSLTRQNNNVGMKKLMNCLLYLLMKVNYIKTFKLI